MRIVLKSWIWVGILVCLPVLESFFISSSFETMRNRTLLWKGKMKLLPPGNSTCWIFQGRHQDVQWNLQNWYHCSHFGHTNALNYKKRQYPWQLLTSLDTHSSQLKRSFQWPHKCTRWHRSSIILGLQLFSPLLVNPCLATGHKRYTVPKSYHYSCHRGQSSNKSHIFSTCKSNPVLACSS